MQHRLRTLGRVTLERPLDGGGWEIVQRAGKPLALLVRLVCQERRRASRELLADLLWGDESPGRSRASLRQALYTLRTLLGDQAFIGDNDEVVLAEDAVLVDRDAFLRAARAGDLAGMLEHYGGDFCAHLDLGGASAFERWMGAERARLRALLVEHSTREVTRLIGAGSVEDAVRLARRVSMLEPSDAHVQVGLFDALVASGAIAEASERLTAFRAAQQDDEDLPPELEERSARLRRLKSERMMAAPGGIESIGQVLVGRDQVLSDLLHEAERARAGEARRALLVGGAGMGKTRVLDEYEARMRLRGARVVRVRLLPGMHGVPLAAFADILRALSALPGALGISERSARELTALVPELGHHFPGARDPADPREDRTLMRRDAYADLLASVSEERLVVLMVDDLQYADDESRRLMVSVARRPELRLLELWGLRPELSTTAFSADREFTVDALSEGEIRLLLDGVATLPSAEWATALVARLRQRSRGVPQVVLQIVRAVCAAGELRPVEGEWSTTDPDRLLDEVTAASPIGETLRALDPDDRRLLRILAIWGRPLDERDLEGILRVGGPIDAAVEWRSSLRRLDGFGLVQSRDSSWSVAHDLIVDAMSSSGEGAIGDETYGVLLEHWRASPRLSLSVIEHLALLAGASSSSNMAVMLIRAVARTQVVHESGLRGVRLARAIARAAGQPSWEPRLYRSMGFISRRSETGLAALGVVATMLVGTVTWLAVMLQPRLIVEAEPMGEEGPSQYEFAVQPRVGMYDGFGRLLNLPGRTRARVDHGVLVGDTVRSLDQGRAQFRTLALIGDSAIHLATPVTMTFTGAWYVRSARAQVRGVSLGILENQFRVVAVEVNGSPVEGLLARAFVGDTLRFDLTFEFSTLSATANYVVGASPTWGRREESVIRLAGLPSPVQRAWRSVTFEVLAPPRPGVEYMIILFALEERVDNVFSSTNWAVGAPIWNDGNDVVDLGPGKFEELRRTGLLHVDGYLWQGYQGRQADVRLGPEVLRREVDTRRRVASVTLPGAAIRLEIQAR